MGFMQEEKEVSWMHNCHMDITGTEKCQCEDCAKETDEHVEYIAKPDSQTSQETSWLRGCQMDVVGNEKCQCQYCAKETDGNAEHVVKPPNIQASKAMHSYRIMRLKSENEKLHASMICKRCNITKIQTLTLPCCHVVCCEACADAAENCPLCDERILGTVRIFIA